MRFERQESLQWHLDVPGSRWFKSDLHVHTVDDIAGGRIKMPTEIPGDISDPLVLSEYAKAFLQGAVRVGVHVIGLTPHATKVAEGPETCAVWQIVDTWNNGNDSDGVPFRNKIYAVFPGFEPNVKDGGHGMHMLFLFDPEIGRDQYLSLFEAVMDGRAPWNGTELKLTTRDARGICKTMDDRQNEKRVEAQSWDYLVLAPHFQGPHGLLREVKSQVLEAFPCERIAAYELEDQQLPEDFNETEKPGSFLLPFMAKHRQAFLHSSDAYSIPLGSVANVGELGYRTTWVKLASPRIEALRQAFIADESRLRLWYERDAGGNLRALPESPDALQGMRPWLRRITLRGGASFFGGRSGNGSREVSIDLSPDLTCVIGGSMTGKSTLLDGLRMHIGARMPSNDRLSEDVVARGRGRFLAGQPEIQIDTPGQTVGPLHERWPAVFYTQNELQRLAQDPAAVEEIIIPLVPAEQVLLQKRKEQLQDLDQVLNSEAFEIGELLDKRAEAEQQLSAAKEARKSLETFQQAGLSTMQATEKLQGEVDDTAERALEVSKEIKTVVSAAENALISPTVESEMQICVERTKQAWPDEGITILHTRAVEALKQAHKAVRSWASQLKRIQDAMSVAVTRDRSHVEKRLAEMGVGAERLAEFQTLSGRARMLAKLKTSFDKVESDLALAKKAFDHNRAERSRLVKEQREAFERVMSMIERQFKEQIRVRRIDFGISTALESFLQALKQKGITQWWNSLDPGERPSPDGIFEKLTDEALADLGVSSTVEERFEEVLTEAKRLELLALRSPDRYLLELRIGASEYREASRLSGGRKVSLLLSLLLQAHDKRPIVIDQPEDELDNRFLWDTVLPALRQLKGKRQVIVATHNANIVVNGDADLVVQLVADAEHGEVAVSGAIENPQVRTAIIDTVDGGEKAFELRKAKYGF